MGAPDTNPPRVLLVDDTEANLIALRAVLDPVGAMLLEARSGREAIEVVAKNWLAAVLIDVQMPEMDGFETAARIRASDRGREVPILFLTAIYRDEAYAQRGYRIGAADYITKPFDPDIVRARVKAFVDLYRQRESRRRDRLETALHFAPALVTIFRASDHVCDFGNATFRNLLGGREVVGSSAEELGATPEMMKLFAEVATTGAPVVLREHALTIGTRERVFDLTLQPLRDDGGQVDAILSFAIDVTDTVLARQTLERARAQAERANEAKDQFLATASHELRTPLSSILGWAVNARRKNSSIEVEKALDIIERNARTQARLIDDILDVSRIIGGRLLLEISAVEIGVAVANAVDSLRPVAEAKGVELVTNIDDLGTIDADPDRIQQVIWNIVANAIKFTERGGRVAIAGERSSSEVLIRVLDSGEGIDPSFLPHLFEPFWQGDASTTRRQGGLGLGLAIVREIVHSHRGTIAPHSEGKGRGTSMTIRLPLRLGSALSGTNGRLRPIAVVGNASEIRLDGMRLLVVDDDPDARLLLRELLVERGATVTCVSGAREALTELHHSRWDVVISDIAMPEVDGLALMQEIRRLPDEQGGRTPAIALSALARAEDANRALAAGYQSHAKKPVDAAELLSSVTALTARGISRATT